MEDLTFLIDKIFTKLHRHEILVKDIRIFYVLGTSKYCAFLLRLRYAHHQLYAHVGVHFKVCQFSQYLVWMLAVEISSKTLNTNYWPWQIK